MIRILAIETSCDETAAAVVEDGRHILSNVVASQVELHARYGGGGLVTGGFDGEDAGHSHFSLQQSQIQPQSRFNIGHSFALQNRQFP